MTPEEELGDPGDGAIEVDELETSSETEAEEEEKPWGKPWHELEESIERR